MNQSIQKKKKWTKKKWNFLSREKRQCLNSKEREKAKAFDLGNGSTLV